MTFDFLHSHYKVGMNKIMTQASVYPKDYFKIRRHYKLGKLTQVYAMAYVMPKTITWNQKDQLSSLFMSLLKVIDCSEFITKNADREKPRRKWMSAGKYLAIPAIRAITVIRAVFKFCFMLSTH